MFRKFIIIGFFLCFLGLVFDIGLIAGYKKGYEDAAKDIFENLDKNLIDRCIHDTKTI